MVKLLKRSLFITRLSRFHSKPSLKFLDAEVGTAYGSFEEAALTACRSLMINPRHKLCLDSLGDFLNIEQLSFMLSTGTLFYTPNKTLSKGKLNKLRWFRIFKT